jgi:hypothetical protein
MAHVIKANGTMEEVFPANGVEFELEEIRQHIGGGHIEAVPYTQLQIMYIDSDGVPKQLPLNKQASEMISFVRGRRVPIHGDALVGTLQEMGDEEPMVILPPVDEENRLHVVVTRVNQPCSECGSTVYPNLEYNFPMVGSGVLCRTCLTNTVDEINTALASSWGTSVTWSESAAGNPDPHKHDYLHAEDEEAWQYRENCICELCSKARNAHQAGESEGKQ